MKARVVALFFLFFVTSLVVRPALADHGEDHQASATAKKNIEYAMPYPGLLPDSPFYGLKMIRDRVVEFLISDPLKQAEFDLLQADKRVGAGIYLINKDANKANAALTTIAKGQAYFRKAFKDAKSAKQQGYPIKTFVAKMHLASQKQQELLGSIETRIPEKEKGYYQRIMKEARFLVKDAGRFDAKEHVKE